jgi:hypothetical protein
MICIHTTQNLLIIHVYITKKIIIIIINLHEHDPSYRNALYQLLLTRVLINNSYFGIQTKT